MNFVKSNVNNFVEAIEQPIMALDIDCNIFSINKLAQEFFEKTFEEYDLEKIRDVFLQSELPQIIKTCKTTKEIDLQLLGKKINLKISPIQIDVSVKGALIIFSRLKEDDLDKIHLEILDTMLNTVNEWVVVVNEKGIITMMSKAYKEFINMEDVEGKHVTEVIENTRMHIVVQTGIPEIGEIQEIRGNRMVAMRIPIIKEGKVVGAVGKVMFKDMSNFHSISKKLVNLEREIEYYKNELGKERRAKYSFEDIIGSSQEIHKVKTMAARVAKTDSNVLIYGESGTGKELFAHAIHSASKRAAAPFIKVNCAAIPAQLLESELFGYEEGAFTGAKKGGKKGKFELANNGTILLDEIGYMPMDMQVKLLRVIQEKEIERVGGNVVKNIDFRIIASTNKNLEESIKHLEFREDLFYRLDVMKITIPPLRERREDIIDLSNFLMKKVASKLGIYAEGISKDAMNYLHNYNWPGNIRELENVIERALNLMDSELSITTEQLPDRISKNEKKYFDRGTSDLKEIIEVVEKEIIAEKLKINSGNKNKTAKQLGISRVGLYKKIEKYNLDS
ncbi:sigma 54-interacting transcriptional regulator [Clostridium bowmanii]|uniref:sigma-54 interaction domain-containing protein n=1 Tax=Clostridium bowmanii TaxID=132925 RepID=UPI001C0B3B8D|nr:sigma 54-interacting transcriptional regulator [Clostridium bowmanii]MBU3190469.1 sigma 54-interacting transcriptional regulator [Clostridium bowmanii]MCA1074469.1 sigma 54-interacting transcriptional regulator [Clostridium bowmanii]